MLPHAVQHMRQFSRQGHDCDLGSAPGGDLRPIAPSDPFCAGYIVTRRLAQAPIGLGARRPVSTGALGAKPRRVFTGHESEIRRDARGSWESTDLVNRRYEPC